MSDLERRRKAVAQSRAEIPQQRAEVAASLAELDRFDGLAEARVLQQLRGRLRAIDDRLAAGLAELSRLESGGTFRPSRRVRREVVRRLERDRDWIERTEAVFLEERRRGLDGGDE